MVSAACRICLLVALALISTLSDYPLAAASYHDYDELTAVLQQVAADHPAITRLVSAGASVEGRELWWLKITDNPDVEEDEPGFKYIGSMHGNEPVGTENCLRLIDLFTDGYGSDPRLSRLVDEVEIWIMPMMNPDGNDRRSRLNANGVDLNRDFPDQWYDPVNTTEGRQPETRHLMEWQSVHTTVLSANFHTGALVVRYPFDHHEPGFPGYSAAPDDDIIRDLSIEYAEDNVPMVNGEFIDGITNGSDWAVLSGGMQDWNYVYHGDIQVTIELSNRKWPAANQLDRLWDENREAMISYMERVLTGVRGVITDQETGRPVAATLAIAGRNMPFQTDPEVGDFHRPLPAGGFDLVVEAEGYFGQTIPFVITDPEADAVRVDLEMEPQPTAIDHAGYRITEDSNADGWLDPGENGWIAVDLYNGGRLATGLTGSLRVLTPYAAAPDTATWPDLHPAEAAESELPHLELQVSPQTPAGHSLSFAVEWESAEGLSGITDPFFVPVSAPSRQEQAATDLPQGIVDLQTIESVIDIPFDERIVDANVRVDISHPFIGDLQVTLVDPAGGEYRLHDLTGDITNNLNTWYDTETEPVDSLNPLIGSSSLGTWALRVTDVADKDQGTLEHWALELYARPFEDPVAEVLLRSVTRAGNGQVVIEWWPVGSADSYKVYRAVEPSTWGSFTEATLEDPDDSDTRFLDTHSAGTLYWIVTPVGHTGEGIRGHFEP